MASLSIKSTTTQTAQRQPANTLLTMTNVRRTYGEAPHEVVALDGINFAVELGEMVAIMGPSGSGKSTMLTIAGGLESPTSGSINFAGQRLEELSSRDLADVRRRDIGFVFQGFNLLDGLTALENVAAPLELDGMSVGNAREEATRLMSSVGLGDRCDAFPEDLSGGERQRVAIARGLVGNRRLLLTDEPTGALDSETGATILGLLHGACTTERSVVVVTHDPNVAAWADRVVVLRDGKIDSTYKPTNSPQAGE